MRIAMQRERGTEQEQLPLHAHIILAHVQKRQTGGGAARDALEKLHRKAHCVIQDEQVDAKAGIARENGKGSTLLRERLSSSRSRAFSAHGSTIT